MEFREKGKYLFKIALSPKGKIKNSEIEGPA